jgi:hypothetical protein
VSAARKAPHTSHDAYEQRGVKRVIREGFALPDNLPNGASGQVAGRRQRLAQAAHISIQVRGSIG